MDAKTLLRDTFVPFIVADKVSQYPMMLAASSYSRKSSRLASDNAYALRLQTVAYFEIARAVSDPFRTTTDHTILGVAQMALYEARLGNGPQCTSNSSALHRLLYSRGGLHTLGLGGLLSQVIHWMDYAAATMINNNDRPYDQTSTL